VLDVADGWFDVAVDERSHRGDQHVFFVFYVVTALTAHLQPPSALTPGWTACQHVAL